MKRALATILTVITVSACLSACQNSSATEKAQPEVTEAITVTETAAVEETTMAETTEKETVPETTVPETTVPETEVEKETETEEETAPIEEFKMNTGATIEETVLYDEDGLRIIAKELTFTRSTAEIKLRLENGGEKALSVTSNTVGYSCNAVNGRMIEEGYINVDLAPGKNAIETVDFSLDELLLGGTTEISEIELGFTISDDDRNFIYTGPLMLTTSLHESHEADSDSYQKAINSEYLMQKIGYSVEAFITEDLPEGDYVSVVSEAEIINRNGSSTLFIELLNTSDVTVHAAIGDIALNGLEISSGNWDSVSILGNHSAFISVKLDSLLEKEFSEILGINEYSLINANIRVDLEDERREELEEFPIEIKLGDSEPSFDDSGDIIHDGNDIRVISKGFHKDPSGYLKTIHILFIVENSGNGDIYFTDKYNSFSLNDLMTDALLYSKSVGRGEKALMDLEIFESSFKDADIKGIDDIETAQFTAEIRDENYNKTDSFELTFTK